MVTVSPNMYPPSIQILTSIHSSSATQNLCGIPKTIVSPFSFCFCRIYSGYGLPDLHIMPLQLTTCLFFFSTLSPKQIDLKKTERRRAGPYPPGPSSGLWLRWRLGKIFGGGTKEEVPFAISPSATTQHAPSLGYWRQQPRLQLAHRTEASCTLYLVFLRQVYQ